MKHHAIVLTTWKDEHIEEAHNKAKSLFDHVTEIVPSNMNGYRSFFIPPDGSKEGWSESETGDMRRAAFKHWLAEQNLYIKWVEFQYGDDEGETEIIEFGD